MRAEARGTFSGKLRFERVARRRGSGVVWSLVVSKVEKKSEWDATSSNRSFGESVLAYLRRDCRGSAEVVFFLDAVVDDAVGEEREEKEVVGGPLMTRGVSWLRPQSQQV